MIKSIIWKIKFLHKMRKRHIFIRKMAINTQFTRKIQVVNKHEKK